VVLYWFAWKVTAVFMCVTAMTSAQQDSETRQRSPGDSQGLCDLCQLESTEPLVSCHLCGSPDDSSSDASGSCSDFGSLQSVHLQKRGHQTCFTADHGGAEAIRQQQPSPRVKKKSESESLNTESHSSSNNSLHSAGGVPENMTQSDESDNPVNRPKSAQVGKSVTFNISESQPDGRTFASVLECRQQFKDTYISQSGQTLSQTSPNDLNSSSLSPNRKLGPRQRPTMKSVLSNIPIGTTSLLGKKFRPNHTVSHSAGNSIINRYRYHGCKMQPFSTSLPNDRYLCWDKELKQIKNGLHMTAKWSKCDSSSVIKYSQNCLVKNRTPSDSENNIVDMSRDLNECEETENKCVCTKTQVGYTDTHCQHCSSCNKGPNSSQTSSKSHRTQEDEDTGHNASMKAVGMTESQKYTRDKREYTIGQCDDGGSNFIARLPGLYAFYLPVVLGPVSRLNCACPAFDASCTGWLGW
jgi:hypothetical protein